jgi:16S rRNA (cytosine967-C5)-methyltransferase
VVDLCAGAGGKTLAMAARMANSGTIHAYDIDRGRLEELGRRAKRAGVTMAFARLLPEGEGRAKILGDFRVGADRVVVDAPCSGTGTWRRNPEGRWRLTPDRLASHRDRQQVLLKEAATLVKSGGRLIYMTCSVLRSENADSADRFLADHENFRPVDYREVWRHVIGPNPAENVSAPEPYLTLTPGLHGTDGFFIAIFERMGT